VLYNPRTNDEIRLCEGRGFSRLFILMYFIVRASLTHSPKQAEHRVKLFFFLSIFFSCFKKMRIHDEFGYVYCLRVRQC